MKVIQQQTFRPIAIVLETEADARALLTLTSLSHKLWIGTSQSLEAAVEPTSVDLYKQLAALGVQSYDVPVVAETPAISNGTPTADAESLNTPPVA